MGLLKEIYETAKEAAGPRWFVLTVIVATIVGRIDWLEENFRELFSGWLGLRLPDGDQTMIFGFPSWIVGLTVLFAFLAVIFLNHARRLKRQLTPKLETVFDPESGGVSVTTMTNSQTGELIDTVKYVRLAVNSASLKSVPECVASLVKIERRLDLARTETLWDQDALPLEWSVTGGYETKVHYLTKRYVDVARAWEKTGQVEFLTIIPNRLAPFLERTGTFLLTVVVTGGGISSDAVVEIETDGTFDGFKARAV